MMDQEALHEAAWAIAAAQSNHRPNNWLEAASASEMSGSACDGREYPHRDLIEHWIKVIKEASRRNPQLWFLPHDSPNYPPILLATPDAPAGLFVVGQMRSEPGPSVAIVGSRAASQRSLIATRGVAAGLAEKGVEIVSGLALGVDGAAHRGALDAAGHTIAVLGSGVDIISPVEHVDLAWAVSVNGAVVSQFPPGQRPNRTTFPTRNAVIAGLSQATLVMDAAEASGTRIEMNFAMKFGRPVLLWEPTMSRQAWAVELAEARDDVVMVDSVGAAFAFCGQPSGMAAG